jgi:hypothetical protein
MSGTAWHAASHIRCAGMHVFAETHLFGFLGFGLLQQMPAVSISCCILISIQACECATLIRLLGFFGLQSRVKHTALLVNAYPSWQTWAEVTC